MKRFFVLVAILLATSAQTPPPDSLRHLVYHVSTTFEEPQHVASYGGTATGMATGGGVGTVTVDIIAVAKDGGLVARATQQYQTDVRPTAPVTCAIYSDGRVICPPGSTAMPPAINVLFAALGRYFYDPSAVAADGTWSTSYQTDGVKAQSHFTRKSAADANPVVIDEVSDVTPTESIHAGWHSTTHIVYDASMSVPDSIHDVATAIERSGGTAYTTVDLTLQSDSFAKKNGN
ncbi:MAG TPA: hypothetical protein VMA98_04265 [Candidatus Acidoferrales bacterium]|nr:hypothetical protein [Candidatus Acidoferrales bacterium]